MLQSMTGFGDASSQLDGEHYAVELRSLNHKYFKALLRLPEDLQPLEPSLEAALRRRFARGSFALTVRCSNTSAAAAHTINTEALTRYVEQLRAAPSFADGSLSIPTAALLGLPGVLQSPPDQHDRIDRARGALLSLLEEASDRLGAMRHREGEFLTTDMRRHGAEIAAGLSRVRAAAPESIQNHTAKLRARVEQSLQEAGATITDADLAREVAIYADRSDIAEEIDRLCGHVQQFHELLDSDGAQGVGRTLDFLAQEMLREANTIGSKCNDGEIAREIVQIKAAIDRIKEQAQNAA